MYLHARSFWNPRTIILVLSALIALILASPVHANGVHLGSQEVHAEDLGPYTVSVTTVPVIGSMHMVFFLSLKDTEFPVLGSELTVWAEQSGGRSITLGPIPALREDIGPNWFAANFPVEESGKWTFTLQIDAPLAEETTTFTVFIRDTGGVSLTLVAIVAAIVAVITLWLGRVLKKKKRRRPK